MGNDQRSPFSLPTSLTETSIGCGVTVDTSGNAVAPSAGGGILGVLYGLSGTGTSAVIRACGDGKLLVQYGGSVTAKDPLKVNASGQFITASASDVQAGACVGIALETGASGELHSAFLFGNAAGLAATGGVQDIVLGTTAPDGVSKFVFVSTTGTVTGAVPDGKFIGQELVVIQYVAASTPVGTITGHFKNQAATAKGTLNLGTATGFIFRGVWDGTAYRQSDTLGGTGSSLS